MWSSWMANRLITLRPYKVVSEGLRVLHNWRSFDFEVINTLFALNVQSHDIGGFYSNVVLFMLEALI